VPPAIGGSPAGADAAARPRRETRGSMPDAPGQSNGGAPPQVR